MKKLLFVLISSLAAISLFAQSKSLGMKKFYVDFGAGAATHNGSFAQIGATAVLRNNWTFAASYYNVDADPKNLPSDFAPAYTIFIVFPVPDPMPSSDLNIVNFTAGKCFERGRKTWFTTEAGLSIVSGKTFHFTPQRIETDLLYVSSSYAMQQQAETTLGGMFKADFNWAFTRFVGLSIGAFGNLNSVQSLVGAECKLTVGWLNHKKE